MVSANTVPQKRTDNNIKNRFIVSFPLVRKKDRPKGGRGVHNHYIIDSVAFIYTPTAPQPEVRDDNGTKTPITSDYDAVAPDIVGL